jgi:dynactin complex subunit
MVQALSGRQGAVTKMKQIQETIMLKTELERRSNDLLAIVWKMNELHLVNKTISAKAMTREQYSTYLSDYLLEIQAKNQRIVSYVENEEKKLRDENSDLRNQLDGVSLHLWQLGEHLEKAPIWRCSVPFRGEFRQFEEENLNCRLSVGNLTEEEIDGLVAVVQCGGL